MSTLPPGYRHGHRQPCRDVRFPCEAPFPLDTRPLDHFLTEAFQLPAIAEPLPDAALDETARAAARFGARVAELAIELLRAARLPLFEPCHVVQIQSGATADVFNLRVRIPTAEGCSDRLIRAALGRADALLRHPAIQSGATALTPGLLDDLHEQLVLPARRQVGGGVSTIPLLRRAFQRGLPFLRLAPGVWQLGWGHHAQVFDKSACDGDAAIGLQLAHNKTHSNALLRQAGFPVPESLAVTTPEAAVAAAETLGYPVVIKPADRERGEGVSVDVTDAAGVEAAMSRAREHSPRCVVEKQVTGWCHRILLFKGRLLHVVKRWPRSVQGDGQSSVKALIAAANAREDSRASHLRDTLLPEGEAATPALTAAGLHLDSVPAEGQWVALRRIETTEWGGEAELFTDSIHPANLDLARRAAALFGLQTAGVDLMTTDITRPWWETGAALNEINFAPALGEKLDYQRASLNKLLDTAFPIGGRIPVEVFVGGGAARRRARERQETLWQQGIACYLCTDTQSLGPHGERPMAVEGLFSRSRSLLLDRDVAALILVASSDSLVESGLPVDRLDRLELVDEQLSSADGAPLGPRRMQALRDLLQQHIRRAAV